MGTFLTVGTISFIATTVAVFFIEWLTNSQIMVTFNLRRHLLQTLLLCVLVVWPVLATFKYFENESLRMKTECSELGGVITREQMVDVCVNPDKLKLSRQIFNEGRITLEKK